MVFLNIARDCRGCHSYHLQKSLFEILGQLCSALRTQKKNNRTKFFCCFFLDNSVQICVGSVISRSNVSNFNNPSGGRPRLDHRDKIQFRRVHFGVFDVLFRASGTQLGSDTYSNSNFKPHKGTFQKLLSGFCPLRGGGYPTFPLSFF